MIRFIRRWKWTISALCLVAAADLFVLLLGRPVLALSLLAAFLISFGRMAWNARR
jgi:hypothetical protein